MSTNTDPRQEYFKSAPAQSFGAARQSWKADMRRVAFVRSLKFLAAGLALTALVFAASQAVR